MHGVLKVRRTADEDARIKEARDQENERFKALALYILQKRQSGHMSSDVLLKIAEALQLSPNWNTFWNYRRENVLSQCSSDIPIDARIKILNEELGLTNRCLQIDIKSYPTWHHRTWVMSNHPRPNWRDELNLCAIALKKDGRNFHCWDYRRFVVGASKTPPSEELKFLMEFFQDDLGNYSAWHYRSNIVGALDVVLTAATPVSPPPTFESLKQFKIPELPFDELDLVKQALFTDPEAQGPWYYFWWNLGRGIQRAYIREVYLSRRLQRAVIVFSNATLEKAICHIQVNVTVEDDESDKNETYTVRQLGGWKKALDGDASAVWWFDLPKEIIEENIVSVSVHEENKGETKNNQIRIPHIDDSKIWLHCRMEPNQHESLTRVTLDPRRLLNFIVSPVYEPVYLETELENIRELVSAEPNNRYALRTLVCLLRYIRPKDCTAELESTLKTLRAIDSIHSRAYADWASAHSFEDALVAAFDINSRSIKLSNAGLTCLCCLDWCSLMTKLDFSNNQVDKIPRTFAYLVCLRDLNLDDNLIESLAAITGLPQLKRLSICRNQISTFEGLEPVLSCPNLRDLDITGNEVTELPHFTVLMSEHPSSKRSQNSLNVVYNKPIQT